MSLNVKYLGLDLSNPIIASSSPLTMSLKQIVQLEKAGIGAVVLKSIFEEQVSGEVSFLEGFSQYPEAADYLNHYVEDSYLDQHLKLIRDAKESVNIPIIASINCLSDTRWLSYAESIEEAGADALELNIFILPTDINKPSAAIEGEYIAVVKEITKALTIPVVVKISPKFTNALRVCKEIYYNGAKGVVMFNSLFEPDIDIDKMELVDSHCLSCRCDLRKTLRNVALVSSQLPKLNIAVSTGVHTGEDVIKAILVGAQTAQLCTTLLNNGNRVIGEIKQFMQEWMDSKGFTSLSDFRGRLSFKEGENNEKYQRVQYMKFFPKAEEYL